MIISGGGYRGPKEVKYLFIDGGYLRKTIESLKIRYNINEKLEFLYSELANGFTKSFYYDGPIPRRDDESEEEYSNRKEEQTLEFNRIRNTKGYHVFVGNIAGSGGKARQKQVDVKLSVDMLMHTIRRNMHSVTLIAGDQDFKPLVDALVQEGMYVTLWCDLNHTSDELVYAADDRRLLNFQTLHAGFPAQIRIKYPLPDCVNRKFDASGYENLENTGTMDDGRMVNLYSGKSGYLLIIREKDSLQAFHCKHTDLGVIEKYIDDLWDYKVSWKEKET